MPKAFSCHLWHLTLEIVPLTLFSSYLKEVEKRTLADYRLAVKPIEPISLYSDGKSSFPKNIDGGSNLADWLTKIHGLSSFY